MYMYSYSDTYLHIYVKANACHTCMRAIHRGCGATCML